MEINNVWQKRCDMETRGRHLYKVIPNVQFVNRNKWFQPGIKTTYILTGHGTINKKLYEIRKSETPNCPFCPDAEENVEHLIIECLAYDNIRSSRLKQ